MQWLKSFDQAIKHYRWYDISLIKLSVAAFVLMIAKLWPPLLNVGWYWYLLIAIAAGWSPMKKVLDARNKKK